MSEDCRGREGVHGRDGEVSGGVGQGVPGLRVKGVTMVPQNRSGVGGPLSRLTLSATMCTALLCAVDGTKDCIFMLPETRRAVSFTVSVRVEGVVRDGP